MRFIATLLPGLALFGVGELQAQQAGSGWLGVVVKDLTKEEADALGWDAPRGAKVTKLDATSPAAKELTAGDIIRSIDKQEIDGKAEFEAALATKAPGAVVKLRLLRGGREKTVSVTISDRPAALSVVEAGPLLMLDTGGHMALISDIAFTPDGKQLVSASNDKTIRVWDLATGKTVRTIRGESAPGNVGKIYAIALSPDGKWLAVGGWFCTAEDAAGKCKEDVRLYDFASGQLVALLKGHEDVVYDLAFLRMAGI